MKQQILLVDDDPLVGKSLSRILHKNDFETIEVTCTAQALAELESKPIDVVVSDEMMPGMRGTDFLAIVTERWPAIGRIMLTGQADLSLAMRAINQGHVHQFITKPCQREMILQTIKSILKQQELEQSSRKLLEITKRQARILDEIESTDPGLTKVDYDHTGSIRLECKEPETLDQLIGEMNSLINA